MAGTGLPQLRMRHPRLEELPAVGALPSSTLLRRADEADEAAIALVQQEAFGDVWTIERVRSSLTRAADVDASFVAEVGGAVVASASAQVSDDGEGPRAFLHWVGAALRVRGLGLGRAVCLFALEHHRACGFAQAYLMTDDFRLPAIRTYLGLGFEPYMTHESHAVRWMEVRERLKG